MARLGIKRHPDGLLPGVFFFADLGGVRFLAVPGVFRHPMSLGVLGVCALGVFLYLRTTLWASGVEITDMLTVFLTRSGEGTWQGSACRGPFPCWRVGSICHRSRGADGGCFRRMRSFSLASEDIISLRALDDLGRGSAENGKI